MTREEALEHAAQIVQATDLPVTADLENGFADEPEGVAQTVRLAAGTGLAGCSVEDFTGHPDDPIYDPSLAVARVAAAAEAAHGGPSGLILTARAENYLHGRLDLADTISRLQAYQQVGADVLYAPGLTRLEDIRQLVASVDRPVEEGVGGSRGHEGVLHSGVGFAARRCAVSLVSLRPRAHRFRAGPVDASKRFDERHSTTHHRGRQGS